MQPIRGRRTIAIVILLIAFGVPRMTAAAMASLRVAYPAPTASFLPLWTAHDAGFFKKNNLAVELIQVGSSTRGMAAMLANQIDVLAGGGTGGVVAQLQGFSTWRYSAPTSTRGFFRSMRFHR